MESIHSYARIKLKERQDFMATSIALSTNTTALNVSAAIAYIMETTQRSSHKSIESSLSGSRFRIRTKLHSSTDRNNCRNLPLLVYYSVRH